MITIYKVTAPGGWDIGSGVIIVGHYTDQTLAQDMARKDHGHGTGSVTQINVWEPTDMTPEAQQERTRKAALAKLSPDEIAALGLKP